MNNEARAFKVRETGTFVQGTGRFRPRARLLRTIGAELISSEIVAIIELVRNSYDADATRVELRFTFPESREAATLELWDNGHGMSRETLLGPWLEPATDFKTNRGRGTGGSRSPEGRRRLGSKGVGRFAAQRLGSHLRLFSRTADAQLELQADFDWTRLDRADQYLDQLEVPWREQGPERLTSHGTSLLITRLRDDWTWDRFERLRVALSRLVSPTMNGDEFSIHLVVDGAEERIEPALDQTSSMYSIEGRTERGGRCFITYRDMSGVEEEWERQVMWPPQQDTAGPFRFRINAWDLDREPLERFFKTTGQRMGLRDFRRLIREHSGISLYRDGFRILPYGEPDNDWLRLDRRRVNNPTLRFSNNQILGWVHLMADENPHLRDQTNREGLVVNDAYQHLQRVMIELLGYLEARRFTARRAMNLNSTQRSKTLPGVGGPDEGLNKLLDHIEQGADSSAVKELRGLLAKRHEALNETVQQYASLASAGQLSSLVFSQLRHPIRQARTQAELAREDLEDDELDSATMEDVRESLDEIVKVLSLVETRIKRMDPLAAPRRGLELELVDLREALEVVVDAFADELNSAGVSVIFEGDDAVAIQSAPAILQQVLSALLENSIYWSQQGEERPAVRITLFSNGFTVSNSGPPIPPELKEAIFEPHFSRREGARGMGLTLARDLLSTVGGQLTLNRLGSRQSFKVVLR